MKIRNIRAKIRRRITPYRNGLNLTRDLIAARFKYANVSIFHEFSPPPGGGGHQFLRALWTEFEHRGLHIENNTISNGTRACLFNAFNFDFERLRRFKHAGCRMVHRVDGPVGVYRSSDDGTDRRVLEINQELAQATIFQSNYSLQRHLQLGMEFQSPHVIINSTNPVIFHQQGKIAFSRRRKIRIIATSWSDNSNKGADTYKWVEEHLDWNRFDFTFVGRSPIQFKKIKMIDPIPSHQLACLLHQHDIFITASRHESCSNALIEALACGLPALYICSGSNAEIVGLAGLGFADREEIPLLLDQLVAEYEVRQTAISLPTLAQAADQYLSVMGIETP